MIDRALLNDRITRLVRDMDEVAEMLYNADSDMGWLSDRLDRDGADLEHYQIYNL